MKMIFDIETDDLNATKVWCLVAKELNGKIHKFGHNQIQDGLDLLSTADALIGHNIIGFDLPVLEKLYDFKFTGQVIDTLVMSRLYNPVRENGHSLKTWGFRVNMYKKEQPEFTTYSPEMLEYCVGDVCLNEKVYEHLLNEGKGFSEQSLELEHRVAKIINQQEKSGFYFDSRKAMELLADLQDKKSQTELAVQTTFKLS